MDCLYRFIERGGEHRLLGAGRRPRAGSHLADDVRPAIALVGLVLSTCAGPSVIETINVDVNHNHAYSHYAKADFRELKPGAPGNCAAIAFTKKAELARHGISALMMTCRLNVMRTLARCRRLCSIWRVIP